MHDNLNDNSNNVATHIRYEKGDLQKGFGEADLTADGEVAVGCAVDMALDVVSAGLLEIPGLLLPPHAITSAAKIPATNSPVRAIRLFRYPVCLTHRTWSRLSPSRND